MLNINSIIETLTTEGIEFNQINESTLQVYSGTFKFNNEWVDFSIDGEYDHTVHIEDTVGTIYDYFL